MILMIVSDTSVIWKVQYSMPYLVLGVSRNRFSWKLLEVEFSDNCNVQWPFDFSY